MSVRQAHLVMVKVRAGVGVWGQLVRPREQQP